MRIYEYLKGGLKIELKKVVLRFCVSQLCDEWVHIGPMKRELQRASGQCVST